MFSALARSSRSLGSVVTTNCSFRFGAAKTQTSRLGSWAEEEKLWPRNSLSQHCPNERSRTAKQLKPDLRLMSSSDLNRTPGIECLSVIIVVIISKEWVAATKPPPRLTFTGFRGRLIYTLVTLHPNFHILATVLCASQNCLACNLSLSS